MNAAKQTDDWPDASNQFSNACFIADIADFKGKTVFRGTPVGFYPFGTGTYTIDDYGREATFGGDMTEMTANVSRPACNNDRAHRHIRFLGAFRLRIVRPLSVMLARFTDYSLAAVCGALTEKTILT